jgi:hypothetical protein
VMIVILIYGYLFLIECMYCTSLAFLYNNGAVPLLGGQLYIKDREGLEGATTNI